MKYFVPNLFGELAIDVLLIHYRNTIFVNPSCFTLISWMHFESTTFYANWLWIHGLFLELTLNLLFIREFTIKPVANSLKIK